MKTEHADRARGCIAMKDGPAALRLLSNLLAAEPSEDDGSSSDGAEGIAPERRAKGDVTDPLVMSQSAINQADLAEGMRRMGWKLSPVTSKKPELGRVVRTYLECLTGSEYIAGITMLRNAGLLE
jgi:hypothetical protein